MTAASDKLPFGRLAVYVFAGGALVWVIFLAVQLLYYSSIEKLREERVYKNIDRPVQILQREQRAQLAAYRWVDQEKKKVGIPIERAMADVVKQMKDD